MAHLNFENDVNNLLRLDGHTRGPAMRWQRKAAEANSCNTSINTSTCVSPMKNSNKSFNNSTMKTPSKTPLKTPRTSTKTPGKTPGKGKTPSKTPSGDRFIPSRSTSNFDVGHFKVMNERKDADSEVLSPTKLEQQKLIADNLNGGILDSKILSYKSKPPQAPEGYQNNLRVLYSQTKTPGSCKKSVRHIPQLPERILDAPDILDDYYLNLIDWSCNNHLAVSLGGNVYLWNATNGDIQQLLQMENPEDYVASVSWIKEGNYLAVGTSNGEVQLWDITQSKRLRNMTGHAARVGSLSWNSFVVSSGSRSGNIHHHDVRVAEHHIATLSGHTQEVCGLKWSPDGKYLASGGNDNLLNIWTTTVSNESTSPLHTFTQHQAAVKAVAWCPWQPSVLASGGGTADRHIRFWNANTGTCLNSVDTKSQVCSILWSKEYKELVSAHGFANNQLIVWKYPTMAKVTELTGHTSRVLHMAMSPDGTTVVSAAADETLRLWKCFAVDAQRKKEKTLASSKNSTNKLMRQNIR